MYLRLQLWFCYFGYWACPLFQACTFHNKITTLPPPPPPKKKTSCFFLRGTGDVSEHYHLDTPIKKGPVMAQLPNPHLKINDFPKKNISWKKKTPLNNRQGSAGGWFITIIHKVQSLSFFATHSASVGSYIKLFELGYIHVSYSRFEACKYQTSHKFRPSNSAEVGGGRLKHTINQTQ